MMVIYFKYFMDPLKYTIQIYYAVTYRFSLKLNDSTTTRMVDTYPRVESNEIFEQF